MHALLNLSGCATKVLLLHPFRAKAAIFLLALPALVVCSRGLGSTSFSPGVQVGTIANASITEASGIAASRRNANVLWVHNDSGDTERVFVPGVAVV
jgi:hypothetical protein